MPLKLPPLHMFPRLQDTMSDPPAEAGPLLLLLKSKDTLARRRVLGLPPPFMLTAVERVAGGEVGPIWNELALSTRPPMLVPAPQGSSPFKDGLQR